MVVSFTKLGKHLIGLRVGQGHFRVRYIEGRMREHPTWLSLLGPVAKGENLLAGPAVLNNASMAA